MPAVVERIEGRCSGHVMLITRDGKCTTIDYERVPGWIDPHHISETAEGKKLNAKIPT